MSVELRGQKQAHHREQKSLQELRRVGHALPAIVVIRVTVERMSTADTEDDLPTKTADRYNLQIRYS